MGVKALYIGYKPFLFLQMLSFYTKYKNDYNEKLSFTKIVFLIYCSHILRVLTTRMQSIEYPYNYSITKSFIDIFKGRTPIKTLFLCGICFNFISSLIIALPYIIFQKNKK